MGDKTFDAYRKARLYPGKGNRFQVEWSLTDTSLTDAVKISLPPLRVIPIIFVPGIMGSNLCDLRNQPVWLLNSVKNIPVGLAYDWSRRGAGARQLLLHPKRTKVYSLGAVPKVGSASIRTNHEFIKRGWGEVSEASYHKFLLWLDGKLNAELNPALWEDFTNDSLTNAETFGERLAAKLPAGLTMQMKSLPDVADNSSRVQAVTSDELLRRSKANFPVYAFGYNWLASNKLAAESLKERIEKVIKENNVGAVKCTQVILVTHSMGGLVARACSLLPEMSKKIVGIVHGVMPSTGAAVAYRRCKVGMRDEAYGAGLVIGSDGKEVTAVFAQSPGALQLLPSEAYGSGWLEVNDQLGRKIAQLPKKDPYEEIYLQREFWWGLMQEEWLSPRQGNPIKWDEFAKNVRLAREFHRSIVGKYHENTYVFYGGGTTVGSYSKVRWNIKKGLVPFKSTGIPVSEIARLNHGDIRTDGSNNLYVGGERIIRTTNRGDATIMITTETSDWEIRCAGHDSAGDGTVPTLSGREPRQAGAGSIKQQFEISGIEHEAAYRDSAIAQTVTYYAITKLAATADLA